MTDMTLTKLIVDDAIALLQKLPDGSGANTQARERARDILRAQVKALRAFAAKSPESKVSVNCESKAQLMADIITRSQDVERMSAKPAAKLIKTQGD